MLMNIWGTISAIRASEFFVIFRFGKILNRKAKGPGLFFILPLIDFAIIADLRLQAFDIPKQLILTKDFLNIIVDGVVYLKVFDPVALILNVENALHSAIKLSSINIFNVLGSKTLMEILENKEDFTLTIKEIINEESEKWGVLVIRVDLKDIIVPDQMQRTIGSEAEAIQWSKAGLIFSNGEVDASTCLKEASDVLAESPLAISLKYQQILNCLASQSFDSTILFPFPIDMRLFNNELNFQETKL